eukprot:TRINITY_DN28802_c0_g1_i1.p1 TRINITY_DN28802_c0_g1~~TRINITY_DN28802_c0_g1_i1.p1  ORF type:complete len:226 (-),score=28.05 TRINITY_DN28802_c0_g1_i1:34-711(-)
MASAAGIRLSKPLVAASEINVGRLAGAIKARIRNESVCKLEAIGPMATHKALKSVVMANDYLRDNPKELGQCLALAPVKAPMPAQDGNPESFKVSLTTWLMSELDQEEDVMPDFFVPKDANPGIVAGDMTKLFGKRGRYGVVTMSAMGALATSKALKAVIIARIYMAPNPAETNVAPSNRVSLEDDETLAVVVRTDKVRVGGGEERVRMLLSCLRVTVPANFDIE